MSSSDSDSPPVAASLPDLCLVGGMDMDSPGAHSTKDMARAWHELGGRVLYTQFPPSRWRRRPVRDPAPGFRLFDLPCRYLLPWSSPESWRRRQVRRSRRLIAAEMARAGFRPATTVFLYYGWFWAGLPEAFPAARHVYDCVDESTDFPQIARLPRRVAQVRAVEARLVEAVDLTLAVSPYLAERQGARARRGALLPNGIDPELWRRAYAAPPADDDADNAGASPAGDGFAERLERLERLPRPRAALVGRLQPKTDLDLVDALARRRPEWGFALIGPAARGVKPPRERDNLVWLGGVPQERLPRLLARVDAGLTPLRPSVFNEASCPLKILEYIAAGLAAVATNIPMAEYWRGKFPERLFLAGDLPAWEAALAAAFAAKAGLAPPSPAALAPHTWRRRALEMARLCGQARP